MEDITEQDIVHFSQGPSYDLDVELARLRRIEKSTIEDLCSALP